MSRVHLANSQKLLPSLNSHATVEALVAVAAAAADDADLFLGRAGTQINENNYFEKKHCT